MRKLLAIGMLSALAAIAIFSSNCNNNKGTTALSKEDSLQMKLDRGKYLVYSVVNCVDCHSELNLNKYSLPLVPGTEGAGGFHMHEVDKNIPGKIYVPNITPYALKDWTDEEIAISITRGINKNGDTLFPLMPFHGLSAMAKEDVDAVVAFIRTLKPIENSIPKREMFVPMSVFGPLPDRDYKLNTMPDTADLVKYGEYLVTIGHCTDCHTPATKEGPPDISRFLAGGMKFDLPTFSVTVANITPDSATGIGSWSETMFLQKFRTNSAPEMLNTEPGKMNTLMPWSFYGTMKDNDLKAVYAYLRTIKPISQKIEKWQQ
jgi:mono/diheme cytochrome c family protein